MIDESLNVSSYIVYDLEWNQPQSRESSAYRKVGDRLTNEIIQIGAVKLSPDNLAPLDTFTTVVKPRYYRKLMDRVKKITHLTESELAEGPGFAEVIREFRRWCGDDAVFLTWGPDDTTVLRQNLDFYGMEIQWMTHWYDLQLIFNRQTGNSGQKSLAFAAEHFNIDQCLPLHNALNDAYYTALVCEELDLEQGISTYPNLAEHRFTSSAISLKNQMYDGFENKLDALRDGRVRHTNCPDCGEKMLSRAFTHQTTNKYITLAECAEHGRFLVQVRFSRGKTLKAWKTVYRANDDAEKMYLARLNEKKEKKAKTAAK